MGFLLSFDDLEGAGLMVYCSPQYKNSSIHTLGVWGAFEGAQVIDVMIEVIEVIASDRWIWGRTS